ncbi:hypothetical protein [Micromonospora sp. NPDC004551]|uniref:hypothetical protein n=1 Tax=Micromonospora sp. NPDC004551 TaxID=3154284 RepID=UPI0033AD7A15
MKTRISNPLVGLAVAGLLVAGGATLVTVDGPDVAAAKPRDVGAAATAYTRVETVNFPGNSGLRDVTVACPAGLVALSGGWRMSAGQPMGNPAPYQSYPLASEGGIPTAWAFQVMDPAMEPTSMELSVVCAGPASAAPTPAPTTVAPTPTRTATPAPTRTSSPVPSPSAPPTTTSAPEPPPTITATVAPTA